MKLFLPKAAEFRRRFAMARPFPLCGHAVARRAKNAGLAHSSNIEYVIGNFDDFATLGGALAGVERAFLLSPSSAEQVTREGNFIRAAKRAGLHHVVTMLNPIHPRVSFADMARQSSC